MQCGADLYIATEGHVSSVIYVLITNKPEITPTLHAIITCLQISVT